MREDQTEYAVMGKKKPADRDADAPSPILIVPIDQIIVDDDKRSGLNEETVSELAQSMRESNLLHPIGVTIAVPRDERTGKILYRLEWGAHRYAAAEMIGWPTITATIYRGNARLAAIDENIARRGLSALERSTLIAKRKEIYEELHPTSKRGAKGGKKAKAKDDPILTDNLSVRNEAEKPAESFAADTAKKTGQSERTIARQVEIGKGLVPEVAAAIKKVPAVADNQTELRKLAKLDPDKQRAVAACLKDGSCKTVSEALAGEEDSRKPKQAKPAKAKTPPAATEPGPPSERPAYTGSVVGDLRDPTPAQTPPSERPAYTEPPSERPAYTEPPSEWQDYTTPGHTVAEKLENLLLDAIQEWREQCDAAQPALGSAILHNMAERLLLGWGLLDE